jgi:integrase
MPRNRALLPHGGLVPRALAIVPYLTAEEVARLARACQGRHRARDEFLILTLFQTGLRVSEALGLTPRTIDSHSGRAVLFVEGKGKKPRLVACPDPLAYRLKSYAFDNQLGLDDRLFRINRKRALISYQTATSKKGKLETAGVSLDKGCPNQAQKAPAQSDTRTQD